MGPQPHTYGRGRFFRGRARGPFFAAGRYNRQGPPLLHVLGGSPPTPPTGPPYSIRARATDPVAFPHTPYGPALQITRPRYRAGPHSSPWGARGVVASRRGTPPSPLR
eukprot:gene19982-biopygen22076